MTVYPKENYVHIKPFDEPDGKNIVKPSSRKKKTNQGEILAVHESETELKEGDVVYFKKRPMAMREDETVVIPKEHILLWN
jgi:co-chaperonin GroES (HSP10)